MRTFFTFVDDDRHGPIYLEEGKSQCTYTPSRAAVAQADPDLKQAVPQLVSGVDVCRVISLNSLLVARSPPCTWLYLTAHGVSS